MTKQLETYGSNYGTQ